MSHVYYNEIDPFPCRVIEANIARGRLPPGRVDCRSIEDVNADELAGFRQFHLFAGIGGAAYACRLAGVPDDFSIGTMGFPCQDISCAGAQEGIGGARSGLFFHGAALFRLLRPRWLLLENVPNLRTAGASKDPDGIAAVELVIATLESIDYSVFEPVVVGADDVEAPQRRKRVWIVARSNESLEHSGNLMVRAWPDRRGNMGAPDGSTRREGVGALCRPSSCADGERGLENAACSRGRAVSTRQGNAGAGACDVNRSGNRVEDANGPERRAVTSIGDVTDGPAPRRHEAASRLIASGQDGELADGPGSDDAGRESERNRCRQPQGPNRECGVDELADTQHDAGSSERRAESGQWRREGTVQIAVPCGNGELADTDNAGWGERRRALSIPSQFATTECSGSELRWPARPGQQQHDWEHPRTTSLEAEAERMLGGAIDGLSERLVRHIAGITGWSDARAVAWWQRNQIRLASAQRRHALKGYGNAWVPQVAVPILQWIMEHERKDINASL